MADVHVRRVRDLDEEDGGLWHATVSEADASEVVDVHVDGSVESAGDFDLEQVVKHRIEHELDELPDGPERLAQLQERAPIHIGLDELERWRGLTDAG